MAGKEYPSVCRAAAAFGLTYSAVVYRIQQGWPTDEAFGVVDSARAWPAKSHRVGGLQFESRSAAANHFAIAPPVTLDRLRSGWNIEQALGLKDPPKRRGTRSLALQISGRQFRADASRRISRVPGESSRVGDATDGAPNRPSALTCRRVDVESTSSAKRLMV